MASLRIGTSGYVYKHWKHVFYPDELPARLWLPYFALHFDCVELNAPFYRLPTPGSAEHWAEQVPARFRFAVKGSRFLTHMKRLRDTGVGLERFFDAIEGLGRKRGPILWQLPSQFRRDLPRLEAFLEALPRGPHAFEFRSEDWLDDEVFELLERHGASLVVHDHLHVAWPWPPPGPFVYWRFHGVTGKYEGRYGRDALRPVARRLEKLAKPAWVFFNNDLHGDAISDAFELKDLLGLPVRREPPDVGRLEAHP